MNILSLYGAHYTSRRAILLINLGSPDSPSVEDVHTYLRNFLMDEHVISISPFWRSLLVERIICPRRAPRSAKNYEGIWDEQEQQFPLIIHSARIAEALSERKQIPVALAMRYGKPTMEDAYRALAKIEGLEEVVIAPLYPHYTRSSFLTAADYAKRVANEMGVSYRLRTIPPFYDFMPYRKVLADSIRPYLTEPFDKLIVSLHGIPTSHLPKPCTAHNGEPTYCYDRREQHNPSDALNCYRLHCESTAVFLREDLGLKPEQLELVYQSRLGWHPWLKPYMKGRVPKLPKEGAKRILVVCPGFVCDCLETLYEIDEEYHEDFMKAGGERFTYIPCLNSSEEFIRVLDQIVDL